MRYSLSSFFLTLKQEDFLNINFSIISLRNGFFIYLSLCLTSINEMLHATLVFSLFFCLLNTFPFELLIMHQWRLVSAICELYCIYKFNRFPNMKTFRKNMFAIFTIRKGRRGLFMRQS